MARAKTTVRGRAPLVRDSQQWILDYLIQETGKVFHFQGEDGKYWYALKKIYACPRADMIRHSGAE